jgi:hypothetical protein
MSVNDGHLLTHHEACFKAASQKKIRVSSLYDVLLQGLVHILTAVVVEGDHCGEYPYKIVLRLTQVEEDLARHC